MLVLALDTSTRTGSCALARGEIVLREETSDGARTHAERLPSDLMRLLERERTALADIDVFAVATGPGSFTGLRVGIAAMQGLAFATGKPLIGVSSLDALAWTARATGRIATWIDAWRGEVYAALYEGRRQVEPPTVTGPDAWLQSQAVVPTIFIGDGVAAYSESIQRWMGDHARFAAPGAPALAGAVAMLASLDAEHGHLPPPHAIRPLYVRRPDAEIARDERAAHNVTLRDGDGR